MNTCSELEENPDCSDSTFPRTQRHRWCVTGGAGDYGFPRFAFSSCRKSAVFFWTKPMALSYSPHPPQTWPTPSLVLAPSGCHWPFHRCHEIVPHLQPTLHSSASCLEGFPVPRCVQPRNVGINTLRGELLASDSGKPAAKLLPTLRDSADVLFLWLFRVSFLGLSSLICQGLVEQCVLHRLSHPSCCADFCGMGL